jgi:hypothetical protein
MREAESGSHACGSSETFICRLRSAPTGPMKAKFGTFHVKLAVVFFMYGRFCQKSQS